MTQNTREINEMMELVAEFLEDRIELPQFERLNQLMAENPQARSIFLDMIILREDLKILFGETSQTAEIPILKSKSS